jgi:hypothetical protein
VPVTTTVTTATGELSFNFGTASGWSYLSAGYGRGQVRETGWVASQHFGGGARWFVAERLAVGFDLRFHRLSAGATTPSTMPFVIAAGVSVR